jgi:hypothetical protein
MPPFDTPPSPAAVALPTAKAIDLRGELTTARHDLDRLQGLLADACADLRHHFTAATAHLQAEAAGTGHAAARHLAGAVTALQFQDLASQLIHHASDRLRDCAEQVRGEGSGPDHARRAHANPVAQAGMAGGLIELF